jgi:hypothetical protein
MKLKAIALKMLPILAMVCSTSFAQDAPQKKHRHGSWYVSWGYNQEWYTKSTIYVKQAELGNDYQLVDAKAHDHMGWNNKSIFKQAITIPQYNYRIGYYFNEKQDMGIELNFDHTKYILTDGQTVQWKGTYGNKPVDQNIEFSEAKGFYYFLNNGANFFLFNFVKRFQVWQCPGRAVRFDFLGKAGIGPVVPHVENKLFGEANDPHFQIGGWNTGLETAIRATVMKYGFIEVAQKVDYARYSGMRINKGTIHQAFGTYELMLTAGFTLPTHPGNPLFADKSAHKEAEITR